MVKIFTKLRIGLPKLNRSICSKVQFDSKPYELHLITDCPPNFTTLTKGDAATILKQLLECRRMEEKCAELYTAKLIRGFCHLYTGQEACAVGIKAVLRPGDTVITSYRCHAWTYLMNGTIEGVVGELMQRGSGVSRGKGGSMHTYGLNFYGGNGIVGSQVPLGTGNALMHKYKKTGFISVTCYGDGAANQGQTYEAFNIAKLWHLPVLYIVENNQYALGTAHKRAAANPRYFTSSTFVPGIQLDGMDVLAVREAAKFGINYVGKEDKGPLILELLTYRYRGHSMSDPGISYRSRDEIKQVRDTRDPIALFKKRVLDNKLMTDEEMKKIDNDVKAELEKVVEKLKNDPMPKTSELGEDVYVKSFTPTIRGTHLWQDWPHKNIGKPINID